MSAERRAMTGVAIKWAQLIIALGIYLLSIGALYATMRSQIDENARRVKELEQQSIGRDQFNEMRDAMIRRLDRIETKLDRLREAQ